MLSNASLIEPRLCVYFLCVFGKESIWWACLCVFPLGAFWHFSLWLNLTLAYVLYSTHGAGHPEPPGQDRKTRELSQHQVKWQPLCILRTERAVKTPRFSLSRVLCFFPTRELTSAKVNQRALKVSKTCYVKYIMAMCSRDRVMCLLIRLNADYLLVGCWMWDHFIGQTLVSCGVIMHLSC